VSGACVLRARAGVWLTAPDVPEDDSEGCDAPPVPLPAHANKDKTTSSVITTADIFSSFPPIM
jgi:hypothetical protein